MKRGPDTRSNSREPVRIDIYLNMFILISLVISYECLGPTVVRRRLEFFFTCSVFVYISKVLHSRSVQSCSFVFTCLREVSITLDTQCYVMSPQIPKVFFKELKEFCMGLQW